MDIESMVGEERYAKMQTVLEARTSYFSLVLENLYDPHNISAILRSAEAYGMKEVHIVEDKNPFRVSKGVCMGADHWLDIKSYRGIKECLSSLKDTGHRVFVADPKKNNPTLERLPLDKPFVVLMGQEKWGVSDEAKEMADEVFQIPLYGFVESFNVSVATAIIVAKLMGRLREYPPQGFFLSQEEKESLLKKWILNNQFQGKVKEYLKKQHS